MNPPLAIGVIGAGRHAAALAEHQAPLPDVRIARWAASPGGADLSVIRELATRIEVPFAREWEIVARDPDLRAVLVLSEGAGTAAAEAALGAGKTVFCAVPAATRPEDVNRLAGATTGGRGILLAGGAIRHSPAGREALRLIGAGELGRLHSLFATVKLPAAGDGDRAPTGHGPWAYGVDQGRARAKDAPVLEEAGWDLLDFIVAATASPPARIHAHVDALFGSGTADTAVSIVRFEDGLIATIEVARCLPPSIPAAADGEVEVEVIGARQAVRLAPGATAVRVHGAGTALRPWVDAPVISMLDVLAGAAKGDVTNAGGPAPAWQGGIADVRRAVDLMEAILAAAQRPAVRM